MPQVKAIALTPDALDRNGITTTETLVAARLTLLINGALATGYDRNGIATTQTPTGADEMTLDGVVSKDFTSRGGAYIQLYAAADDTGRTFTVVGADRLGNTVTETITGPGLGLITAGTTKFWSLKSVTPDAATAGAIEVGVNGYISFTTPQHVAIYSAADDTGDTFTVTGLDRYGNVMTEAITGLDTDTALGTKNFARVDDVTSSGASTGAVEVGVVGTCESQWLVLNYRGGDFNVGIGCDISTGGGATYAVQHTFNDVFVLGFVEDDAVAITHSTLTGETTNQDGNYTNPPAAMRLALTAFTSGTVTMRVIQAIGQGH
jgi:hypothetical protein